MTSPKYLIPFRQPAATDLQNLGELWIPWLCQSQQDREQWLSAPKLAWGLAVPLLCLGLFGGDELQLYSRAWGEPDEKKRLLMRFPLITASPILPSLVGGVGRFTMTTQ